MKRFLLLLLLGFGVTAGSLPARADESGEGSRSPYAWSWFSSGGMEAHINQLNRMVGQMRWQMSRYHPDGSIRRDFAEIRREIDQVNGRYQQGGYDRRQLRREIDDLHDRLHQLEIRMHVRARDYYVWR